MLETVEQQYIAEQQAEEADEAAAGEQETPEEAEKTTILQTEVGKAAERSVLLCAGLCVYLCWVVFARVLKYCLCRLAGRSLLRRSAPGAADHAAPGGPGGAAVNRVAIFFPTS
eukprot:SAG22_NODE_1017_length_6016_cov_40.662667_2_plen_114_part_00